MMNDIIDQDISHFNTLHGILREMLKEMSQKYKGKKFIIGEKTVVEISHLYTQGSSTTIYAHYIYVENGIGTGSTKLTNLKNVEFI